jgi:hypothetical protein
MLAPNRVVGRVMKLTLLFLGSNARAIVNIAARAGMTQ